MNYFDVPEQNRSDKRYILGDKFCGTHQEIIKGRLFTGTQPVPSGKSMKRLRFYRRYGPAGYYSGGIPFTS